MRTGDGITIGWVVVPAQKVHLMSIEEADGEIVRRTTNKMIISPKEVA